MRLHKSHDHETSPVWDPSTPPHNLRKELILAHLAPPGSCPAPQPASFWWTVVGRIRLLPPMLPPMQEEQGVWARNKSVLRCWWKADCHYSIKWCILFFLSFFLFLNSGCPGSSLLHRLSQLRRRAQLSSCSAWASHYSVFSCGAWAPGCVGFSSCRHGLNSYWSLEQGLSNCGAVAQLPQGMWNLPGPGFEPASHALQDEFFFLFFFLLVGG